ncbi:MAG: hypothetical protein P4L77_11740 [Sulfuriferula sp.]|nr:hypothetical protein [Sulfuriferula sp.]
MSTSPVVHNTPVSVVAQIKKECGNDNVWKLIQHWGETNEAQMRHRAKDLDHESYEVTMVLAPGSARCIENNLWIVGYRFIIEYTFYAPFDAILKQDKAQCFLGFSAEEEIVRHFEDAEIDTFTPSNKHN